MALMEGYSVSPPLMLFDHPDSSVRSRTRTPRISRSPSSEVTLVLPLSQTSIGKDVKGEEYKALVKRIQFGGDEVVQAKAGTGSATLSMGFGEFSLDYHNTSQTDMISRCTIRQLFDPSFER
jgi:hypothetical protein